MLAKQERDNKRQTSLANLFAVQCREFCGRRPAPKFSVSEMEMVAGKEE
jgi:hypothetical protein